MTVAAIQAPIMSLASTACGSEPLFSLFAGDCSEQLSISISHSAMSFDWSDFPVVHQYNEDMPVPSSKPCCDSAQVYYASQPQQFSSSPCSRASPMSTSTWELDSEDGDDTVSFSVSDDETVDDAQVETPRADRQSVVRFSEVMEIRSYPVVLGDHPCCSGLALELGWEHQDLEVVDFDVYENSRQYQRRTLRELRFSYRERRNLLEQSTGLSEEELLLQERRAWADQLEREAAARDKAPSMPKSCSQSSPCILRKVSSTKTLSSMTTATV